MNKKQIGNFIKEQREAQGFSQVQLAARMKVRRQALIEVEKSQSNYGIDTLLDILNALGMKMAFPPDCLIKDTQGNIIERRFSTNGVFDFSKIESAVNPDLEKPTKKRNLANAKTKTKTK